MLMTFIILQIVLLLCLTLHDWISLPPFNGIHAIGLSNSVFKRIFTTLINTTIVLILLLITLHYYPSIPLRQPVKTIFIFYFIFTIGTLISWWMPYIFGSSKKHKAVFKKFKKTHHFLPKISHNTIPNTLHVILHLQIWGCLCFTIYYLSI